MSTSKILTVSYGTFSCTLEGFDDSFETMKAIAEYFRDLAADDRYFGAEPPSPDAEMLARIAEREIARRVEAREERGGIVLRASDPVEPARTLADTDQPQEQDAPAQEPAAESETDLAPHADTHERAVDGGEDENEPEANAARPGPAQDGPAQDEAAAHEETGSDNVAVTTSAEASQDANTDAQAAPITVAREVASDETSIAAKLQRIRAVVSRNAVTTGSEYSEDEHAEGFDAADSAALDAVLTESVEDEDEDSTLADFLAASRPEQNEAEPEADTAPEHDTAVETTAPVDRSDDATARAAPGDSDAKAEDQADTDDVASILDELSGLSGDSVSADEMPQGNDAAADGNGTEAEDDSLDDFLAGLEAGEAESPRTVSETADHADADGADEAAARSDADKADPPAAPQHHARIVKIKRADFKAAIADGTLEEADEDDDWNALDESDLTPEEEAELRAELAQVEAELDDEDDADVDSIFAEADDDTPDTQDRRRVRDQLGQATSERDLTRLMAKTLSEMDEPESTNRRNAIQHLRAAVAATRADKEAGVETGEDTIGEAYREDLASVVQPRRASTESAGTPRPTEGSRPAPLKLVAEQRVDTRDEPRSPVRPRRVSMADIQEKAQERPVKGAEGETFADYAETQGAKDLAEVLEAAASYLSFVEGCDQFSRPQLMTRARSVIGDDFSREDGLRSFGQLLRQGKIQKLKGGRFTVSDQIGFQPAERRAG
ncbi:hypothetical protein M8756_06100 [Lutimaribacter sp. EGI FJ00015]|uniref:Uncharacterized protein n=1 Tax=Lutimaribacter degradans TaxID=2945989 RepID=A0ACC5ZTL9_9RHOB|nr:hypothetical protein [Lutimaribacter sp. EGI FJ00013]MCM2561417.1 hypothetical protein [Lutimaribacter sp. EGI FJ00013]MCO0612873.1 hypothetical protein [Lutimaribacter sp. EGI FJ00015]MCO0635531.1 hypothetical protein [Lutimaribacter sp. EGI FJ00014]